MLLAESNNLPSLPLIVSVSVRTNALKLIIFVSLVYMFSVFKFFIDVLNEPAVLILKTLRISS
jgi:hypothetical protein